MSNRSYDFEITWCWKDEGNRPENIEEVTTVRSTTVPRAISKLVRELSNEEEEIRASDLLVIDVRNHKLTSAILAAKQKANGS